MEEHWIRFSRQDPRNLVFARWAGRIAALQWLASAWILIATPMGVAFGVGVWIAMLSTALVLVLVGYRGMVGRPERRMGALVLLATNIFFVLLLALPVIFEFFFGL